MLPAAALLLDSRPGRPVLKRQAVICSISASHSSVGGSTPRWVAARLRCCRRRLLCADDEIRVNSTDKILTTAPILIRAADGTKEAVYYIRSVSGDRVRLTSPVGREFVPGDLVLQGNPLDEALAGGAIIVGGPAASGGGGISTGALVGIIVGVGAGAGLAAAAAGGGGGNGSPPPPGSQIAP